ncbi:MAG: hypothetical protein ACRCUF_04715 [Aeromonas sobria]
MTTLISEETHTPEEIYNAFNRSMMLSTFVTRNSGPYRVVECTGYGVIPAMCKVEFTETGTELWFPRVSIGTSYLKDPMKRDRYGVGYLGIAGNGPTIIDSNDMHQKSAAYKTWRSMITRCYANGNQCYKDVTVCERWHNFQNFCEDIQKLEGFDMWRDYQIGIRPHGIIELDKDLKAIPGQPKQYGPETCTFLTKVNNLKVRWNRPLHPAGVETLAKAEDVDHHPA